MLTLDRVEPSREANMKSWASYTGYRATYTQGILQTMDTQFSKWSYDLNEGMTSIPFVMAQAPTETHERLVRVDRKLWVTGADDTDEEMEISQTTAAALLERAQQKAPRRASANKVLIVMKHNNSSKANTPPKEDSTSKRAALIAKSKAAKDMSLVATTSIGQRRSTLQRNKNRKSIMPSPPPTARKPEPARKSEMQTEQSKSTMLILNPKEDEQRRDIDSAIRNQHIDFENPQHMQMLMQHLGRSSTEISKGQVIGELEVCASQL